MSRLYVLCFAMLVGIGSLLAPQTAQAAESYDNCTGFITSLPAVITTQGTWCMNQDLVTQITSGVAIEIQTNNVIIDCNDFKLGNGSTNPGTLATGINASNRLNVVIRNCNIRRFWYGINLTGAGHQIEDNRLDGNTGVGIQVLGDGSVVRGNNVFDTGNSSSSNNWIYSICTVYSVDIIDNTVTNLVAPVGSNATAIGIYSQLNINGRIIGNGVRGLLKDGIGRNYGIRAENSSRVTITDNHIIGFQDVAGDDPNSIGLFCKDARGRAKDNVINGFETSLSNCTDAGGNSL